MIERKKFYVVKCDGCYKKIELFGGFLGFRITKAKNLRIDLIARGWQRQGKKWYCPDCQKGRSEADKD